MSLPTDSKERKMIPLFSGLFVFFPDALVAVARRSYIGSKQHHPDEPVSWDRSKSGDELDAMLRHVLDEDWDAVAWRALANLQKQEEKKREASDSIGPADGTGSTGTDIRPLDGEDHLRAGTFLRGFDPAAGERD